MVRFRFEPLEPRVVMIAGTRIDRARLAVLEVLEAGGDRRLGELEAAGDRRGWFAILPSGARTEFWLPSRKQGAEWLRLAALAIARRDAGRG